MVAVCVCVLGWGGGGTALAQRPPTHQPDANPPAPIRPSTPQARDQLRDTKDWKGGGFVPKYLLSTRQCKAVDLIIALCKAHFVPDYHYDDGVRRPGGFVAKGGYVVERRPFNVCSVFGDRDTARGGGGSYAAFLALAAARTSRPARSHPPLMYHADDGACPHPPQALCVYHMQWDYLAKALFIYTKGIRDKGYVQEDNKVPNDPYRLRRMLVCPRAEEADGSVGRFDRAECRDEQCERCRDLRRLLGWTDPTTGIEYAGVLSAEDQAVTPLKVTWDKVSPPVARRGTHPAHAPPRARRTRTRTARAPITVGEAGGGGQVRLSSTEDHDQGAHRGDAGHPLRHGGPAHQVQGPPLCVRLHGPWEPPFTVSYFTVPGK